MPVLEKPFKNSVQKIEKSKKKNSEIAACEPKITSEKTNFGSNTFSHSTSKLELQNVTPHIHSLFRSTSCFGVTKIMQKCD